MQISSNYVSWYSQNKFSNIANTYLDVKQNIQLLESHCPLVYLSKPKMSKLFKTAILTLGMDILTITMVKRDS